MHKQTYVIICIIDLRSFFRELKNLEAKDMSDLSSALQKAFDLLNQKRLRKGIDTFGMVSIFLKLISKGRRLNLLEPATIIYITDGTSITHPVGPRDNVFI
mgnify:CR=1 FL=1